MKAKFPQQVKPLCIAIPESDGDGDALYNIPAFACDMENAMPGTLFRIPLRTEEQAQQSLISNSTYEHAEMLELLSNFAKESAVMLVFLKHLESSIK